MVFNVEFEIPKVEPKDWHISISGQVQKPIDVSLTQLKNDFEQEEIESNIVCLRGATIKGLWSGVLIKNIFSFVCPDKSARWAEVRAHSDYSEPIHLKDISKENAIIAHTLNGKPIPAEQGGKLRLIVPNKYAYKSVKWIKSITLLSKRPGGFWERKGYPYIDQAS